MKRIIAILLFLPIFLFADIFTNSSLANIWVEDKSIYKSFSINSWSSSVNINSRDVYVNNQFVTNLIHLNGTRVLINSTKNSYPQVASSLPSLSLVGLSSATATLGSSMDTKDVLINPNGGEYNKTISVTFKVLSNNSNTTLYYKVNNSSLQSVTLPKKGSFDYTIYLVRSGDYTISYGLNQNSLKVAHFKINQANPKVDSDGDGIPDVVEIELGFDPLSDEMVDSNNNGWNDFDEFIRDNNITDSDGDGWSDWDEINLRKTDPNNPNLCADIDTKPMANSLYDIEYNISFATQKSYAVKRVSLIDIENRNLYDSLDIIVNTNKQNSALHLCNRTVQSYENSLNSGTLPRIRVSASEYGVIRALYNDNNKTRVEKYWLNAQKSLTPKDFIKTNSFAALPDEMNANDYKIAYINYLKANIIKNIYVNIDKNSSVNVALLEAAMKRRGEENTTILLGVPRLTIDKKAYDNTKGALDIEDRDFSDLFNDLKDFFSAKSVYQEALNRFDVYDENISSEEYLSEFLQSDNNKTLAYLEALFTIVSKDSADANNTVYNYSLDSDSDGLSNEKEVLSYKFSNPLSADSDGDGIEDSDDLCVDDFNNGCLNDNEIPIDYDADGIEDSVDNCPYDYNPDQNATMSSLVGDACAKKGVVIISPKIDSKIYKYDNVKFEALIFNSVDINNIEWFIDNKKFDSKKLSVNYQFNSEGNYTVCAVDKTNASVAKSCVEIKVLAYKEKALSYELYTKDIIEGDSGQSYAMVQVELNQSPKKDINLSYATSDISANAGSDYIAQSGTLHFAKNEKRKFIQIPILGDKDVEPNEEFKITVGNKFAKITIINDDSQVAIPLNIDIPNATYNSSDNVYTLAEGNNTHNEIVKFTLEMNTTTQVSFHYKVMLLSQKAYSYIETSEGDIVFNSNESEKVLNLVVHGDVYDEDNRQYKIVLSNPNGVKFDEQNSSTKTLFIELNDDDPEPTVVFYSALDINVTEGNSTRITVRTNTKSYKDIDITISVTSSTANSSDYSFSPSTFRFDANGTAYIKIINFTANRDLLIEGEEYVTLSLAVQNARLLSYAKDINITILDANGVDSALFTAFDDRNIGNEPWAIIDNGNNSNVYNLKDIVSGSDGSEPMFFTKLNNRVYFIANTQANSDSWAIFESSGKAGDVSNIYDFNSSVSFENIYTLFKANGFLYTILVDNSGVFKLYKYDNGLTFVTKLSENRPPEYLVDGNYLYVVNNNDMTPSMSVDRIDLYDNNKTTLAYFTMSNQSNAYLTKADGKIYFFANENKELWKIENGQATKVNGYDLVNVGDFYRDMSYDNLTLFVNLEDSTNSMVEFYMMNTNNDSLIDYIDFNNSINVESSVVIDNFYYKLLDVNNSIELLEYNLTDYSHHLYSYGNSTMFDYLIKVNDKLLIITANGEIKKFENGNFSTIHNSVNNDIIPIGLSKDGKYFYFKDSGNTNTDIFRSDGNSVTQIYPN